MNSRDYWAQREQEALNNYVRDEAEYDRHIKSIYASMQDSIQREIDAFYARYASAEGITIAEAKKRVSRADIAAYERRAARYVRDKDFSQKANEEMRLYNAMMRINRLEMLKANIGLEMIAGHDELEKYLDGILKGRTMDELNRQAGIMGKTIRNNAAKANAIVNASFHNATFSDRVWQYQDLLREEVGKLLQSGLISGKNPRALARDLQKAFDTSTFNAERLMRTELARVQTEAQKQSFERNGFAKYLFIVNSGCCPICEAVAKKKTGFAEDGVYLVENMQPGENAPPMHPHCRCSTAAWEDDTEYEAWLDHLANGGSTTSWNAIQAGKLGVANSENGGIIGLYRQTRNTGAFAALPERMTKKHIREIAKEYGISLKGISLSIDANEDLLRIKYTGCANPDKVGNIIFFPNAFVSKEELLRTIFHENIHVRQYREYGVDYVQNNKPHFEDLAYDEENAFIDDLKARGLL